MKGIALLTLLLALGANQSAQAQLSMAKTEALFLYNFIRYTHFPSGNTPIRIGIVGNSGVIAELKGLVQSRTGVSIEVIRLTPNDNMTAYDLVFVPATQSRFFNQIRSSIHKEQTLLITENIELLPQGACIGFMIKDSHLGYKINQKVLDDSRLKLSRNLTELALR